MLKFCKCGTNVRTFELLKKEAMTNTPTSRQAANIAAFAAKWHEGDLGSGPKVKATAQRWLDLFRDWIWQNSQDNYSAIAGCIEWHNMNGI